MREADPSTTQSAAPSTEAAPEADAEAAAAAANKILDAAEKVRGRNAGIVAIVGMVMAIVGSVIWRAPSVVGIFITLAVGLVLGLIAFAVGSGRAKAGTRMGALAATALGGRYTPEAAQSSYARKLTNADFLPGYERADFSDLFEAANSEYWSIGVHLEESRTETTTNSDGRSETQTHWHTVFRGRIGFRRLERSFDGRTLVLRRGHGATLPKMGFANEAFDRRWNVYSSDGVMAHYLLDPVTTDRLAAIAKSQKAVRALAFETGGVYLVVEGTDKFDFSPRGKRFATDDFVTAQRRLRPLEGLVTEIFGARIGPNAP